MNSRLLTGMHRKLSQNKNNKLEYLFGQIYQLPRQIGYGGPSSVLAYWALDDVAYSNFSTKIQRLPYVSTPFDRVASRTRGDLCNFIFLLLEKLHEPLRRAEVSFGNPMFRFPTLEMLIYCGRIVCYPPQEIFGGRAQIAAVCGD
jgi:hypothetical protein